MARYSRERSRFGTLTGLPSGLFFLSATSVMLAPREPAPAGAGLHPNRRPGGELLGIITGFLAKHLLDSGTIREGV